jgi:hypothetical protein
MAQRTQQRWQHVPPPPPNGSGGKRLKPELKVLMTHIVFTITGYVIFRLGTSYVGF